VRNATITTLLHVTGMIAMMPALCFAAHPLMTDDTGLLGAGGMQLEWSADVSHRHEDASFTEARIASATLTYGISNSIDLALTVPSLRVRADADTPQHGMGDTALELKWTYWDKDGLSLALKPLLYLPTGSAVRGLGNGKSGFGINLLATLEEQALTILTNAGYTQNRNTVGARRHLWNASVALLWKAEPGTKLLLDLGGYRNTDPHSTRHPAFAATGIIFSPSDKLDLDIGLKKGLNKAESSRTVGTGLTLRW